MKILNLFAGIGGNRALWSDDHEITAVEHDSRIAYLYYQRFPSDKVIVTDAWKYCERQYNEFDVIWASPPCQSHSKLSLLRSSRFQTGLDKVPSTKIPDMRLYGLIIFLDKIFHGKWIVENVEPFYTPLITPTSKLGRHLIWSNPILPVFKKRKGKEINTNKGNENMKYFYEKKGIIVDLSKYFPYREEIQIVNNCVRPDEGKWILDHLLGEGPQRRLF